MIGKSKHPLMDHKVLVKDGQSLFYGTLIYKDPNDVVLKNALKIYRPLDMPISLIARFGIDLVITTMTALGKNYDNEVAVDSVNVRYLEIYKCTKEAIKTIEESYLIKKKQISLLIGDKL